MDYLNEKEVEKIIQFNNDEVMKQAVKKVMLSGIYESGTLKAGEPANDTNWAYSLGGQMVPDGSLDDAQLGSLLRATAKGIGYLEDGFKRLSEIKKPEKSEEDENPAV